MNIKNLSREEKEKLYIKKETELQLRWGNPIDDDWRFIRGLKDEEIEKDIEDTIGQLKFEKSLSFIKIILISVILIFVILGIIGLLIFGMKQLF